MKLRWIAAGAVMLLSVGMDFVSATMSIMADAVLMGAAVVLLWPVIKEDLTK
jgi:hypothetical protein